MDRNLLDSKKRERDTKEASSLQAKKSRFLKSLTIPDASLKSSDQPHKLDLSKREIGESSTQNHTRIEVPKERCFGGEIHKVLIRYDNVVQEYDKIKENKLCNILSKGQFD